MINNTRISKMELRRYLVLAFFIFLQCKANQQTDLIPDEKYLEFYSKKNKATIKLNDDDLRWLPGPLLPSFKQNLPRLFLKSVKYKEIYFEIIPFEKDSTSHDGLYIYRTFAGLRSIYYANHATPYNFLAMKGDTVLFFEHDKPEENKRNLERLKEVSTYPKILKYEEKILRNRIWIK
jgi:hypothetical protein